MIIINSFPREYHVHAHTRISSAYRLKWKIHCLLTAGLVPIFSARTAIITHQGSSNANHHHLIEPGLLRGSPSGGREREEAGRRDNESSHRVYFSDES